MAKQRDRVRMSTDEVAAFLDRARTLIVTTLDPHGAPHMTALWFAREGESLLFETYGSSQKVINLRRDPRIAVLAEDGETYDRLRGVSIQGEAEIVGPGPRLETLMATIVSRNQPGLAEPELAGHVAQMVRKRVVVIVHPSRTMSWDHGKLGLPQG